MSIQAAIAAALVAAVGDAGAAGHRHVEPAVAAARGALELRIAAAASMVAPAPPSETAQWGNWGNWYNAWNNWRNG